MTDKFDEGDDVWFYTSEAKDNKIRCTVETIGICNDYTVLRTHEGDQVATHDFERVEKIEED